MKSHNNENYLYSRELLRNMKKGIRNIQKQIPVIIIFFLLTTISLAQTQEPHINIYPNPFADSITYTFTANYGDSVELRLFDLQGRLKASLKKQPFYESQVINLTTDVLDEGVYITAISVDSTLYNSKIIKNGGRSIVQLALEIDINSLLSKELISDEWVIYPNPTNAELTVTLKSRDKTASISLQSLDGTKIFDKKIGNKRGIMECNFNLSQLPKGVYLIRYKSKIAEFSKKIVKSN
ncbi:MAG: T9SS type A sorting domain-containing protein [Cyclobacteriaceae bacterium]